MRPAPGGALHSSHARHDMLASWRKVSRWLVVVCVASMHRPGIVANAVSCTCGQHPTCWSYRWRQHQHAKYLRSMRDCVQKGAIVLSTCAV
jgi:hypothetical protein